MNYFLLMNFLEPYAPDPQGPFSPGRNLTAPAQVCEVCLAVVRGHVVEVDHAHALYGALKGACPALKDIPGLGVHTLQGTYLGARGELLLRPDAEVRLRLPVAHAPLALGLEGAELVVQGRRLQLGQAHRCSLAPFPVLWARTVTLHFGSLAQEAARDQLRQRFVETFPWGAPALLGARTFRIHGQQILGFEMIVRNLGPRASLQLQAEGFGGRRAFGCGLFVPICRVEPEGQGVVA